MQNAWTWPMRVQPSSAQSFRTAHRCTKSAHGSISDQLQRGFFALSCPFQLHDSCVPLLWIFFNNCSYKVICKTEYFFLVLSQCSFVEKRCDHSYKSTQHRLADSMKCQVLQCVFRFGPEFPFIAAFLQTGKSRSERYFRSLLKNDSERISAR